jgi:tetratricopeptide (TPR) repeat protein
MKRYFIYPALLLLFGAQFAIAQVKSKDETIMAKQYFAEDAKCRSLIKTGKLHNAEISCRNALSLANKLPEQRDMEKYSANETVGLVILFQRRPGESIPFFNKALAIGKKRLTDSNAETGELYFYLGQANHLLGNFADAQKFYDDAEKVYRAAFIAINDDEVRAPYPQMIKNILTAHLSLLKTIGLTEKAEQVQKRLDNLKNEYHNFSN